jgi:hypothetical protein
MKRELKKERDSILIILTTCIQSFDYCFYLSSQKKETESDYIENSFFFKFTRHTFWRLTIIELAKLTSHSKNQHFRVFKLLNKLKKQGEYGKLGFDQQRIIEWEQEFEKNNHILVEIENLRNKIYSHTDSNKNEYLNSEITLEEIRKIQNIIKRIIIEISKELLDTHLEIKSLENVEENFKIVEILAENKEAKKKKIISDFIEKANKGK